MYTGKVFNKTTNAPLKNIPVSDGRNIVFTDENGFFSLEGWERCHLIYVCMLTRAHDDWYKYVENEKNNYDFYLSPADTDDPEFSFLHISDTEILRDSDRLDWISFAKNTVYERSPAFFVQTGDIAREYGLKKHREIMNYDTMGCPVRYTIGNHDFTDAEYGEQLYELLYGPTWYSFDCGKIHFIALSISGFEKTEFPTGYENEDQFKWLENDLKLRDPNKKVIILCHTYCYKDPFGFCPVINERTYDIKNNTLLAWCYGHTHINYLHDLGGIYYINSARPDSGGVDSSEGAIRQVNLNSHELTSEMIYCSPYKTSKDGFIWETKLDGKINFSTPVVIDNSIFVGTVDDGFPKKCGIFKVDKTTGNVIWKRYVSNSVAGSLAYDNEKIYAQDNFGKVYCLNAENGNEIWSYDERLTYNSYTKNGVLVADDLVITGNSRCIRALTKENGQLAWTYSFKRGEDSPAKYIYDAKNGQIIVSANWYCLFALDLRTGEVKWQCIDSYIWFRTSTPRLLDNKLYMASRGHLSVVDAVSGSLLNSIELGGYIFEVSSAPTYANNILYIPTANKGVIAVDMTTFDIVRIYPCGNANLFTSPYLGGEVQTVESSPIVDGNTLIFSSLDGKVNYYDINTAELLRTVNAGAPVLQAPIFTDDGIITVDFNGYVTKFQK